jgi:hypothetical protein
MNFNSAPPSPKLGANQRGRDADLVVVVDCQIRTDDLIVHLF